MANSYAVDGTRCENVLFHRRATERRAGWQLLLEHGDDLLLVAVHPASDTD